jgi:hypothetical protein
MGGRADRIEEAKGKQSGLNAANDDQGGTPYKITDGIQEAERVNGNKHISTEDEKWNL